MNKIIMAGLDYHRASVEIRERLAFTDSEIKLFLENITHDSNVSGAVVISTCNRTEVYLSLNTDVDYNLVAFLLNFKKADSEQYSEYFYTLENDEAARYLCQVSCGLHSQIFHEEQIVTQVGNAISLSRKCKASDAVLDTLFRTAVSAGKDSLTSVRVSSVPLSASNEAVKRLKKEIKSFENQKCVVIGNGKIGRLAADLLIAEQADVTITLRSYNHGETIVPKGVKTIPYDNRFEAIDGADIVITATRSPHYTITRQEIEKLSVKPKYLIDLALPRDIEKECAEINGVTYYNIDDFSFSLEEDSDKREQIKDIALKYADEFIISMNYRDSLPYIQSVKQVIAERIIRSKNFLVYSDNEQFEDIVQAVSDKTVDMLLNSMKSEINPDLINECLINIKKRLR